MKIDIEAFLKMKPDAYVTMLKNLHVKQVKQIYEVLRGFDDFYEEIEELKRLTKNVYGTLEHVPNKQESKAIRQALQKQKQSR